MSRSRKFHNFLYFSILILIGIDFFSRIYMDTDRFIFYSLLFALIIVNDRLRINYFYKSEKRYFSSLILTMIVSGLLIVQIGGYTDIYIFMILYELILFTDGKISNILTVLEIIFYFSLPLFNNVGLVQYLAGTMVSSIFIFFYVSMLYTYKNLRKEKRKVEILNREIEELAISKERNRLAGEIHDNLGHNLVGLNMNLDVASKMVDKDLNKAKALIDKSQILTKKSIEDLRRAVYAFKEDQSLSLMDSINSLIDNLQDAGETDFYLDIDEKVEDLPQVYKDVIYKSIKETITNSIKHGNAKLITININYLKSKLKVSIKDNGLGCSDLVKGNGLFGIENRINSIGGEIDYNYSHDEGFEVVFILDIR